MKLTSPLPPCCRGRFPVSPWDQGLVEVAVVVLVGSVGVSQAAWGHSRNGGWCLFRILLPFCLFLCCCHLVVAGVGGLVVTGRGSG